MRTKKCEQKGFTLIELLVVIAIIAILAAILFPVFTRAQSSARQTKCMSSMKQCVMAWMQYSQDYSEQVCPYTCGGLTYSPGATTILPWPGTDQKKGLLCKYLRSEMIAYCPENQADYGRFPVVKGLGVFGYNGAYLQYGGDPSHGYNYDGVSYVTNSMIRQASKTICFIDAMDMWAEPPTNTYPGPSGFEYVANGARHNNGWNVVFCDGHGQYYHSTATDKKSVLYYNKPNGRSVIGANDDLWDLK